VARCGHQRVSLPSAFLPSFPISRFLHYFPSILTSPALKSLTVAILYACPWSHQPFIEFALRSSLDLEQISFHGVELNSYELHELLSPMHSLVELTFAHAPNVLYHLFDALYCRGTDSRPLVPRLKKLYIVQGWGYSNAHSRLARMVESRWWTDDVPRKMSRLETVEVVFYDKEIDARVRDRLARCRREGLILDVS
jgi:hypothetical protein